MEKLTALELLMLIIDADFCSNHQTAQRFKVVNESIVKKLRDEFVSRDAGEREAAFMDIKRIEPSMGSKIDAIITIDRIIAHIKRQRS